MEIKKENDRNRTVEFYRFFFVCVIYILHGRNHKDQWFLQDGAFQGGYLAVEFFFILSGFFIAKKCQKEQESIQNGAIPEFQSVKFFVSRYKKLMPQYLISIVVFFIAQSIIIDNFNLKNKLLDSFSEIIGCSIFWRPSNAINIHLWYVSGLIWAGALVYYLMLKRKNFSICVLFPFSLLIFIGYAYTHIGHIDLTPAYELPELRALAFFRAFVEIGFGCILYNIYTYIRDKKFNPVVMTIVEVALFAAIVFIMWQTRRTPTDFIALFLIGAFVLVAMLNHGYLSKLLNNSISEVLGSISYPMYLNQNLFLSVASKTLNTFSPDTNIPFWLFIAVTLAALMIYSLLITSLVNWIIKKISQRKKETNEQS